MLLFERITTTVTEVLWGTPMLILLVGCGVYYSVRLGFLQVTKVNMWMKKTFGEMFSCCSKDDRNISPYQAVVSALASSIGTGSIVGVATAITAGGAGAVFWMWVSAAFGMMTKYAEIYLAVKFRNEKDGRFFGGPMYYIEKGLGRSYKWMACVFSIAGAFACLGMGAMNQANSIASVMESSLKVPPLITGVVIASVAALAISGGIKRVAEFAEKLVPLMAGMYMFVGVLLVLVYPKSVWCAVCEIFRAAFTPGAIYGATAGGMAKKALRYGVARGVFSNEAGLGSAPIVHAAANSKSPVQQGLWGIFEVFVDTMVVCTITSIVIVSSGMHNGMATGADLVSKAFGNFFGVFGESFAGIATIVFSLTTILGWSYYGESCVFYLFEKRKSTRYIYRVLFVCAVLVGAIMQVESVWELADMFNGVMMLPNLIALLTLSGIVIRGTRNELGR